MNSPRPCNGLVLTEAVLAISLTAALTLSLAAWPALFSRTLLPIQAVLELSTTANILESILRREIHLAGNLGCASRQAVVPPDLQPALHLYSEASSETLPSWVKKALQKAKPGSPVLLVQYLAPMRWLLSDDGPDNIPPAGNTVTLTLTTPATSLRPDALVLLSDCARTSVLRVTKVRQNGYLVMLESTGHNDWNRDDNQPDDKTLPLASPARPELTTLVRRVFYLADNGRKTAAGDAAYSLYMQDYGKSTSEVVAGVHGWNLKQNTHAGAFTVVEVSAQLQSTPPLFSGDDRYLKKEWSFRVAAYNL